MRRHRCPCPLREWPGGRVQRRHLSASVANLRRNRKRENELERATAVPTPRTSAWWSTAAAVALDSSALARARAASPSALSRASRSRSTSATTAAGVAGCGRSSGEGEEKVSARRWRKHLPPGEARPELRLILHDNNSYDLWPRTSCVATAWRRSSASLLFADTFMRASVCDSMQRGGRKRAGHGSQIPFI